MVHTNFITTRKAVKAPTQVTVTQMPTSASKVTATSEPTANNAPKVSESNLSPKNEEELWKEAQNLLRKIYKEKETPKSSREMMANLVHQLCIINPDQLFRKLAKEAQIWLDDVKNELISIFEKPPLPKSSQLSKDNVKKSKKKTRKNPPKNYILFLY